MCSSDLPMSRLDKDSDSESEPSKPDEDDGEGERTKRGDEQESSSGSNCLGQMVGPEELETLVSELADGTIMGVHIVPIAPAAVVVASSIMASNTIIESPSLLSTHLEITVSCLNRDRKDQTSCLSREGCPRRLRSPRKTAMQQRAKGAMPNSKRRYNSLIAPQSLTFARRRAQVCSITGETIRREDVNTHCGGGSRC